MTPNLRPRGLVLAAVCALVAAGCAGGAGPAALSPADIAALEAQRAQHPADPDLNYRLGRAYYAANRFEDARRAIGAVLAAQPANPAARTYLGLIFEGTEQFDSARAVYTRLLADRPPPSRRVQSLLSGRLVLLTRRELRARARLAIARESLLVSTPPDPNTVAVMPFRYTGADSALRPLERGLAALVVTDLSRVRRLRLVERDQIQALLDEMKLAASGRVDPATGARSGRLVGAGQVVQGQFTEVPTANFRVDASVVRASDGQVAASGSGSDQLRALFDIEKTVVFQLLDKMGITLTPAERTAISERPTRDLQAFLLYSRGLEAQDRGDFSAAAQSFQAAAQRDPGFSAAAQGAQSNQAAQNAGSTPPADVVVSVGGAPEPPPSTNQNTLTDAINDAVPSGAATVTATSVPPPTDPGRICEGTCDGPARATLIGTLIIIIKRP
jgi:tetratricopeptide (TPR) repeat protein